MEKRLLCRRLLKLTVQLSILAPLMIPRYALVHASRKSFTKFHPIKKNIHYRLWNPVSNGLIKRDPNDMNLVHSSGGFSGQDYNHTFIQAKHAGAGVFNLVFNGKNGEPDLYISAVAEGRELVLTPLPSAYAEFEPLYYWAYTLFKSKAKSTADIGMYLGINDVHNRVTLVLVHEDDNFAAHYPNPQTLFIVNKVKPPKLT